MEGEFRQPVAKKLPFIAQKESREFIEAMVIAFIRESERRQQEFMIPENVQVFQHGTGWTFQREDKTGFSRQTGELELHSVRSEISTDRILANDLTLLSDFIVETAEKFTDGMKKRIFEEIATVAEEVGNTTVIPKEGPLKDALLDMIRNSHLSVGADGAISRPTLHLDPDTYERFQGEERRASPESRLEAEELWKQKEAEARLRETERLARYRELE